MVVGYQPIRVVRSPASALFASWLVWLDADAMLLNFRNPLEEFVESGFDLKLEEGQ